jgi:hypothetical protein
MRDDFLGAEWSANRHHFTLFVHKLIGDFFESMEGLTRQQFDAPWRRSHRLVRLNRQL